MPIIKFPSIKDEPTLDDVVDYIERMRKELQWALDKNLDTKNAREFAGWLIRPDKIVSKDGDVGMSTADDGIDPIRFWAGDAKDDAPNFIVTKAGILKAVAGLFMSASGYPRVEFNSGSNLLAVYKSATDSIIINPDYSGSPTIIFDNGSAAGSIGNIANKFWINAILGVMRIRSNNDMEISSGGLVKFDSWSNIYSNTNTQTLQQALDAISSSIPSGDYAVVTYSGGVATSGRALTASDIPNIAQSQVTNLVADLAGKASKTLPSWIAVTFQNSWVNFGSGFNNVEYYKDDTGIVHLRGMMKSGVVGSAAFTLPSGYPPPGTNRFATVSNDAFGEIQISTSGNVTVLIGNNAWVSLDGISFRT